MGFFMEKFMPNWIDVQKEIIESQGKTGVDSPIDFVRRKYLQQLGEHTKRNVICYYSGWLQKQANSANSSIDDQDKSGFMATIHGMDRSKGLDLILHTPGGSVTAAESIIHYLNSMFDGNIRAIIPQMSMSAGTMIACGCKSIVMGKQSNIGPFDPHQGGVSCHGVIEEFNKASMRVRDNPHELPLWQQIISKYHPTFLGSCEQAIEMASAIVGDWLKKNMLKDDPDKDTKADYIISMLNDPSKTKDHARHIHFDEAVEMGLIVTSLEEDQDLQDLVLTVHHTFMHTLSAPSVAKVIENQNGVAMFFRTGQQ